MADVIGVPTELYVFVSRKLTDGDYGSFEVSAGLTVSLPEGVNLDDAIKANTAWATAHVGQDATAKKASIQRAHVADSGKEETQPAPIAETRTPVGDEGEEFKDIDVLFIKVVFTEDGQKRAKTFGKPWDKFGVTTYPEALTAIGFDIEGAAAGQYALPAPYKKARVLLGGKNDKGFDIAKKVDHFIK